MTVGGRAKPIRGFISYAHDDHEACAALRKNLASLERVLGVEFWCDTRIHGGRRWHSDIAAAIESAEVFAFLLTPAFFDSGYIMDVELPAIERRYDRESHLALPIVAKDCIWEDWFRGLDPLPDGGQRRARPVAEWKPKDRGWHAVAAQTYRALQLHFQIAPRTDSKFSAP